MTKALFVAFEGSLGKTVGGQQACTNELYDLLVKAGYELTNIQLKNKLNLGARIINRLHPIAYPVRWPPNTEELICSEVIKNGCKTVFFNLIDFLPIAESLRKKLGPKIKLVMLSHGLASADVVHINRIAKAIPEIVQRCPIYKISEVLDQESTYLKCFDVVVSISEFEAELCRWLGAKKSLWLPRTIESSPLSWRPLNGRLGFVGTLDHLPSMEGIIRVLEALPKEAHSQVTVRVASRSKWHADWLAKKFSCIDYLGPLEGGQIEDEAKTWCAFLNPIFCFARGCSTKLATGLKWGLPCLTTTSGLRGYKIPEKAVITCDSPAAFAREMINISFIERAKEIRDVCLSHLNTAIHKNEKSIHFLKENISISDA